MQTVSNIEQVANRGGVVYTVRPEMTVAAAAAAMAHRNVGCLVVVDETKAVLGILTEPDILKEVVARSADPYAMPVSRIMTRPAVACDMQTDIRQAEQLMANHNTQHLPIVEDGVLLGMISSVDIVAEDLSATQELARRQSQVLQDLETTYPGITRMQIDDEDTDDT